MIATMLLVCYTWGINDWTNSHLTVYYKTTKDFEMTCWEVEEDSLTLAWPRSNPGSNGALNTIGNITAEVHDWWEKARGLSPERAHCYMNHSASASCAVMKSNTFNQSGPIMFNIVAITGDKVEIRLLNLTRLRPKKASCTWAKIEGTEPRIYCNWSCEPIAENFTYGYWRAKTVYPLSTDG